MYLIGLLRGLKGENIQKALSVMQCPGRNGCLISISQQHISPGFVKRYHQSRFVELGHQVLAQDDHSRDFLWKVHLLSGLFVYSILYIFVRRKIQTSHQGLILSSIDLKEEPNIFQWIRYLTYRIVIYIYICHILVVHKLWAVFLYMVLGCGVWSESFGFVINDTLSAAELGLGVSSPTTK